MTLKKLIVLYHSENPNILKKSAKSTLPLPSQWNDTTWMTVHLFRRWFTDYFKLIVETYCSENISFKSSAINAHQQCTWSLKRSDGEVQLDYCCFHACKHSIHSAGHGSESNFTFQVLFFKKYIL